MELEGIGKDLTETIQEIVQTGDFAAHRELKAKFPPGLLELLRIAGLGPKRVKQLQEMDIRSLDDLRQAVAQGRLLEAGEGLRHGRTADAAVRGRAVGDGGTGAHVEGRVHRSRW